MVCRRTTYFSVGYFPESFSIFNWLKGIVQRDITAVVSRLKQSVLIDYLVAKSFFFILKGHHSERSKSRFQRLNNCWIELARWVHRIRQTTVSVQGTWKSRGTSADVCTVQHLYRTIISRSKSAVSPINVRYDSTLYNHSTRSEYRTGTEGILYLGPYLVARISHSEASSSGLVAYSLCLVVRSS
jgi:hypothetical protein